MSTTTIRVRPVQSGNEKTGITAKLTVITKPAEAASQVQHQPEWELFMRGEPKSKGTDWHSRGKPHWEW